MSGFTSQEIAEKSAATIWDLDKASQSLGMKIIAVAPGTATVTMPVTDAMLNGYKVCHGGYLFTLADSCFAFSCNTYNLIVLAQGCSIDYVKKVEGNTLLTAVGTEQSRNRTTGVYDVKIFAGDTVVALFRGKSFSLNKPIFTD